MANTEGQQLRRMSTDDLSRADVANVRALIMVLEVPRSPALDWDAPITCEERAGSPW